MWKKGKKMRSRSLFNIKLVELINGIARYNNKECSWLCWIPTTIETTNSAVKDQHNLNIKNRNKQYNSGLAIAHSFLIYILTLFYKYIFFIYYFNSSFGNGELKVQQQYQVKWYDFKWQYSQWTCFNVQCNKYTLST